MSYVEVASLIGDSAVIHELTLARDYNGASGWRVIAITIGAFFWGGSWGLGLGVTADVPALSVE